RVADVDAQVTIMGARRDRRQGELGSRSQRVCNRAVARRSGDLVKDAVAIQRHRAPEDAVVEKCGVDLRLGRSRGPVQLDGPAATAEEVAAIRAGWVDAVLCQDLRWRETVPTIRRLIESDQC